MSPRFPRVTGKDMIRFLQSQGFRVVRIKGSHHVLQNPEGRIVVVPVHGGETLGIGITRKILQQSGVKIEDFLRYSHS